MNFRYTMCCQQCGKKFGARRKTARFCCTSCRVRWNRENNQTVSELIDGKTRAIMTKSLRSKSVTCPVCNANFWVNGNRASRIYCSNACKQKSYRATLELRSYGILSRYDKRK